MDREFYENIFESCAQNLQGFYGRAYDSYKQMSEDEKDLFCKTLNDNNVKDIMDFIMYMEG